MVFTPDSGLKLLQMRIARPNCLSAPKTSRGSLLPRRALAIWPFSTVPCQSVGSSWQNETLGYSSGVLRMSRRSEQNSRSLFLVIAPTYF